MIFDEAGPFAGGAFHRVAGTDRGGGLGGALIAAIAEAAERIGHEDVREATIADVLARFGRVAELTRARWYRLAAVRAGAPEAVLAASWQKPDGAEETGYVAAWCARPDFRQWLATATLKDVFAGRAQDFPAADRAALERAGVRALAIAPVVTPRRRFGVLVFEDTVRDDPWTDGLATAFRALATLLSAALERAEDDQRARGRAAEDEALLDQLSEGVFKTDDRARFTYLNQAWHRMTGFAPATAVGRFCGLIVVPEDRNPIRRPLLGLLRGDCTEHRCEARLVCADGGTRWVQVSTRRVVDPATRRVGLVGTIVDISAIKLAAEQLQASKHEAEAACRAKTEFLSTMSHELRTPLNAVLGLSEALLDPTTTGDADRTLRYAQLIQRAGQQLFRQISDILDLARIDAGRFNLTLGPVDIGSLCAGLAETVRPEMQAKNLRLELNLPPRPLVVQADERLVAQALHHLVLNAVKFTPTGGRVAVSALSTGDAGVAITVADTGIGIEPEQLHRLFKPFSQVDASLCRRYGGTGLGLALVDRFVRLHGGTVVVESRPVFGSTFTVTLPGQPNGGMIGTALVEAAKLAS